MPYRKTYCMMSLHGAAAGVVPASRVVMDTTLVCITSGPPLTFKMRHQFPSAPFGDKFYNQFELLSE